MTLRAAAWRCLLALATAVVAGGCTETLDAGYNRPNGLLPVDERNPIILLNDGAYDNWSGEYAVLLANGGGSPLAGIIVDENSDWPDIQTNVGGYTRSGRRRPIERAHRTCRIRSPSIGAPLVMPANGNIDDTQPNRSEGALLIVDTSKSLALPYRPLVIATGGALTDVADAYLVDPTVTERVVVVSSLGSTTSTGGGMGSPNGDGDPWADFIVASEFRYVQVSAWYDQLTDVPTSSLSRAPQQRSRRLDRVQAAQPVAVVARVGSGLRLGGRSSELRDCDRAGVSGRGRRRGRHGRTRSRDRPKRLRLARHRVRRNGGDDLFWKVLLGTN